MRPRVWIYTCPKKQGLKLQSNVEDRGREQLERNGSQGLITGDHCRHTVAKHSKEGRLTSAQVMISRFMGSSPTSGSVLTVRSLLGILSLSLSLSLKINKLKKKKHSIEAWLSIAWEEDHPPVRSCTIAIKNSENVQCQCLSVLPDTLGKVHRKRNDLH